MKLAPEKPINTLSFSQGIFPIYKEARKSSFSLIRRLRKLTGIRKIGHAGTLDPLAEGVMILLIGRPFTKQADTFLNMDKEYLAEVTLGMATTTFDAEGVATNTSPLIPSQKELEKALENFQGTIEQIPPMFSAKKVGGKKLYKLARKGIEIQRKATKVDLTTTLLSYSYPHVQLQITCSKGTYIRALADQLGSYLHCGGYLNKLVRTRCGPYSIQDCFKIE